MTTCIYWQIFANQAFLGHLYVIGGLCKVQRGEENLLIFSLPIIFIWGSSWRSVGLIKVSYKQLEGTDATFHLISQGAMILRLVQRFVQYMKRKAVLISTQVYPGMLVFLRKTETQEKICNKVKKFNLEIRRKERKRIIYWKVT